MTDLRGALERRITEWAKENVAVYKLNGAAIAWSCKVCGALLNDEYQHARWHIDRQEGLS